MSSNQQQQQEKPKSGSYIKSEKPVPEDVTLVEEGFAKILFGNNNEVFYNKPQVVNRDLSTLVIKAYNQMRIKELQAKNKPVTGLRILEGLSATGLRAIRYWKEIEGIDEIVANDLSADAVEAIRRNIAYNDIPEGCITPNHGDANEVMFQHRAPEKQFDIIDLDPYGTASNFIDVAVQSVKDGGLLCVTCTDLGVLAGSNPGTCWAKYSAMPVSQKACHEQALRIVLSTLQQHANRYKRYIIPLASCSIDFYVRIFVRVDTSAKAVKESFAKFGNIYQCTACDHFEVTPIGRINPNNSHHPQIVKIDSHCSECGSSYKMGGPVWIAPIHHVEFVNSCLDVLKLNEGKFKSERYIKGLLTLLANEVPEAPLFYEHGDVASKFRMGCPPITAVRSAILNAGYKVSQSHCNPQSLKTTAPVSVLYDIYRVWYEQNDKKSKEEAQKNKKERPKPSNAPVEISEQMKKKQKYKDNLNTVAHKLLAKAPVTRVDFTEHADSKGITVPAFLPHPEPNWGPKARAKAGKKPSEQKQQKRKRADENNANEEVEDENIEQDAKQQKLE